MHLIINVVNFYILFFFHNSLMERRNIERYSAFWHSTETILSIKIYIRHTRVYVCVSAVVQRTQPNNDSSRKSAFTRSCFKSNLNSNAKSNIIFSIHLIQQCRIFSVKKKLMALLCLVVCIVLLFFVWCMFSDFNSCPKKKKIKDNQYKLERPLENTIRKKK